MDDSIRFKIDNKDKKKFQELCKIKAINQSELLRRFIQLWLEKNKGVKTNEQP